MELLDAVVGIDSWQCDYKEVGKVVYCGIGIKPNDEWIWKYDAGSESSIEKEKGTASDAFKRAAVKWGIGRFLYEMDTVLLPTKDYKGKLKPATMDGKILWGEEELSNYINSTNPKELNKKTEPKSSKLTPEQRKIATRIHEYFIATCDGAIPSAEKMLAAITKELFNVSTKKFNALDGKQIDEMWVKIKSEVETFEKAGAK